MPPSQCLIITGMHRSHTSYVSQCLSRAGLDLGKDLIGANAFNRQGHFEDRRIVNFHEMILQQYGLRSKWKGIDVDRLEQLEFSPSDVQSIKNIMNDIPKKTSLVYGWKDPRASLFLPQWNTLYPHAYYIIMLRHPVLSVSSLLRRRGHHPGRVPSIVRAMSFFNLWKSYNQRILSFVRTHPDRCLIIHAMSDLHDPIKSKKFNHRILYQWKLHLSPIDFSSLYKPDLDNSSQAPSFLWLMYNLQPRIQQLYNNLRKIG